MIQPRRVAPIDSMEEAALADDGDGLARRELHSNPIMPGARTDEGGPPVDGQRHGPQIAHCITDGGLVKVRGYQVHDEDDKDDP